ncbi:signal peptide peptidase SppA [Odoribacter lunatus]|uniref:signal peptide peptidase SppA n=1 Tax=Odoribacter lunatus TaxID=2941335 RepID=UPI00204164F1|nr:signal peptide peptidase SppA [Odoribacter lunatus]
MKSFFKYVLATIVGFIIINILMLFVFFGFIGAVATMGDKTVEVKDNSILEITLNNTISDRTSTNPFDNLDFISMKPSQPLGLNNILKSIRHAANDSKIKGIYLNLTDIQSYFIPFATTEEIRNALLEFKESGKFIYSYTNLGYSQTAYYLATAADSIFVNPETPLMLMGLGSNLIFYKDLLDKIGVQAEIIKVGKYKSAVEPFTRREISEANREQISSYLNSLWGNILTGIAKERNISIDSLNWLANHLSYRTSQEEQEFGLYDGVCYEDEMLLRLKNKCNIPADKKLKLISLVDYGKTLTKHSSEKNKIAVIYASGEIGMNQSAKAIGPELANTIRQVRENKNVKAVVLRVNSPGGSALTSDIIWREVALTKATKPVIVSMGNVAASGGYYISCAADTILADPMTLTGSIGIFGQFFTGEKLIKDKLGLTSSTVKTNEHSDFGGAYPLPLPISNRPLTAYEKQVLQNYIENGYETFLNRVAEGRHMTRDEVHEVAQGRVWTGKQAVKVGLVDILGGLDDAIVIAAAKAGLEKYSLTEYPVEKNPFEELFSGLSASVKAKILQNELGEYYTTFYQLKDIMNSQQGLVSRIPYDITFN